MENINTQTACEWKDFPKNMNNPLHSMCSYMAMFPPSVPHYFIEKYSEEKDIVLDPFSGRGTTVLEACSMNRIGIGNDINPLAYLLTKAKSDVPQKSRIISRIGHLESEFGWFDIDFQQEPAEIQMIFSDSTLKQLIYLRDGLRWKESNIDAFIAGMVLGIIHGNSEGYLSLSMPNTFSMSPNYVKNYIAAHNLTKPDRNVFELLRRKLDRCYQRPQQKGKAYKQDVRNMSRIDDSAIDLIITSPPYTRVIRYGQFNWIRLWFLGKGGREVDNKLFFSQSVSKYTDFMSDALEEMKRVLAPEGKAVLVVGDVKDRKGENVCNLAEVVWEECAEPLGFKLSEPIIADVISDDSKVSRIWGKKKGNATKIDRMLILEN